MTIDEATSRVRAQAVSLRRAIDSHLHKGELLPATMLLYAAIDGSAWLASLGPKDRGVGENFRRYVTKYLLRGHEKVTAQELWNARCGILHTQTPTSDGSTRGTAREIWYDLRTGYGLVQRHRKGTKRLVLSPAGLAAKWSVGLARMLEDVVADPLRHQAFIERAEGLMDPVVSRRPRQFLPPVGSGTF
jgi:hypothetical protein